MFKRNNGNKTQLKFKGINTLESSVNNGRSLLREHYTEQRLRREALTPGTEAMLFIGTEWFMGEAARGPIGACGNWTFPRDIGLNEFIPGNSYYSSLIKASTRKKNIFTKYTLRQNIWVTDNREKLTGKSE